jgi:hypothetical protein
VEGLPFAVRLRGGLSAALEFMIDPSKDFNGAMSTRGTSSVDGSLQALTTRYVPYAEAQMPDDVHAQAAGGAKIPPETIARLTTHGGELRFTGGEDEDLAVMMINEILDYNMTAWARGMPMIEWIDVSLCNQRNKREGFDTTHGQDFKKILMDKAERLILERDLEDDLGKWRLRFLDDMNWVHPDHVMSAASEGVTYPGKGGKEGLDPRKVEAKKHSEHTPKHTGTLVNPRRRCVSGRLRNDNEVDPPERSGSGVAEAVASAEAFPWPLCLFADASVYIQDLFLVSVFEKVSDALFRCDVWIVVPKMAELSQQ